MSFCLALITIINLTIGIIMSINKSQDNSNVLTEKELNHSKSFLKQLETESRIFNEMKAKGQNIFVRKPTKINGRWYIEQLVKNTNGSFFLTKVLVSKIKERLFIEQTLGLPVVAG